MAHEQTRNRESQAMEPRRGRHISGRGPHDRGGDSAIDGTSMVLLFSTQPAAPIVGCAITLKGRSANRHHQRTLVSARVVLFASNWKRPQTIST